MVRGFQTILEAPGAFSLQGVRKENSMQDAVRQEVEKSERFPLPAEVANREARCPTCGREVAPLTPEQAGYGAAHPSLCFACLEHRTEIRTKAKLRAREAGHQLEMDAIDQTEPCDCLGRPWGR